MAVKQPIEGESFEQYRDRVWTDPDVRQAFPAGWVRREHLRSLYEAAQEGRAPTPVAMSLNTVKEAPTPDADADTADSEAPLGESE